MTDLFQAGSSRDVAVSLMVSDGAAEVITVMQP